MWQQEVRDGVAVATWANPPMNYYNDDAVGQLEEMIDGWARAAGEIRAVVLTGGLPGKFITHFDVDQILRNQEQPDGIWEAPVRSRRVQAMLRRLNDLPQAVIAAMNGDTMGFGFELSLSSDLRILQRGDHRVGLPEVRLGIPPGGSGLTRLQRVVGTARALDVILRARVVAPDEALALGLVTELADDALSRATEIAREIAALPHLAVAVSKKALYQGEGLPIDLALAIETEASFRAKQSPDTMVPMREYLALPLEQRRAWLEA